MGCRGSQVRCRRRLGCGSTGLAQDRYRVAAQDRVLLSWGPVCRVSCVSVSLGLGRRRARRLRRRASGAAEGDAHAGRGVRGAAVAGGKVRACDGTDSKGGDGPVFGVLEAEKCPLHNLNPATGPV